MNFLKKMQVVILFVLGMLVMISTISCHVDSSIIEKESHGTDFKQDMNEDMNEASEEGTRLETKPEGEPDEYPTTRVEEILDQTGITVDWEGNIFSLEGVDPSSVKGSYVLKYEPDSDGNYSAEEIILWDGTYIFVWHHISEGVDHPVFEMSILKKGYYILRDNGTLTLVEENGDQIQAGAFYYFEDGNLVYEYFGGDGQITKSVYVKQ